jgi:mannose-1-phosphate guanylyltransferase
MNKHLNVFIMAGGSGERFWPMSRSKTPKHLLRLLGDRTLLEMTVRRLEGIVPWERVHVLTNEAQAEAVKAELPFLPAGNIIAEPAKRDTAPACALAVGYAHVRDPEAVCVLLPADSMIHNILAFQRQVEQAAALAHSREALVTFAVAPTFPSTGFGYLHLGEEENGARRVLRFVEKPDLPTAKAYLQSGQYAWNAGMFAWRTSTFLRECDRLIKPLAEFIRNFPNGDATEYLASHFPELPKISVDYAIMEEASEVIAIDSLFDWDDVGSWTSLPAHLGHDDDGNTARGPVFQFDSRNNVILADKRIVALCGVENLIVVETADAILVCHRDSAQDIKKLQALIPDSVK